MSKEIHFFNEDVEYRLRGKQKLQNWIISSILSEQKSAGAINIILCSDTFLYKMNVEYLNHDTFTDVITFDYGEDNMVSGDIFISLDRIRENAKKFNNKLPDELHRIIIHGVMHLCGQEDKEPNDKIRMTEKENKYLSLRPEIR